MDNNGGGGAGGATVLQTDKIIQIEVVQGEDILLGLSENGNVYSMDTSGENDFVWEKKVESPSKQLYGN